MLSGVLSVHLENCQYMHVSRQACNFYRQSICIMTIQTLSKPACIIHTFSQCKCFVRTLAVVYTAIT